MSLSTTGRNAAAQAIADAADYLSLHTADPGTTGTSEVTGGSYARQAATWAAASGGACALSNDPSIPVPASTTVTHWGAWTAVSGGTYIGGGALSASEAYTGAGAYVLTDASITVSAT